MAQVLCSDVNEVSLRRMALLPVDRITRCVGEPFQLADRLSQHGRIVRFVDNPVPTCPFNNDGARW